MLPDPDLIISKQHCSIESSGGQYLLTDTSSNGVYLNAGQSPVGRGNVTALKDGDNIRIGSYQLAVAIREDNITSDLSVNEAQRQPQFDDPFDADDRPISEADPRLNRILHESLSTIPADAEFLKDRGGSAENSGQSPRFAEEQQDRRSTGDAAFDHESFEAPKLTAAIPEDWDQTPPSRDSAPAEDHHDAASNIIPATAEHRENSNGLPTSQGKGHASQSLEDTSVDVGGLSGTHIFEAFLEGCGLQQCEIPNKDISDNMRMIGAIYRETIKSLMEVLAARSSIKNEFRLSQTSIKPIENNPLKFSLGVEDAILTLLTGKGGQGYLSPIRAVHEAFDDIKIHQVAVMVGMQSALTNLLKLFDPQKIEDLVDREERGIANVLQSRDSRCWKEFTKLYARFAAEADDDFQGFFSREFARAYEKHLQSQTQRDD